LKENSMPGVTIVYGPLAAAVPTLGGAATMALAAATAFAGAVALRRQGGGTVRRVLGAALAVGSLASAIGLSGHRLIAPAEAMPLGFSVAAGGSLTFDDTTVPPTGSWSSVSGLPTSFFICGWLTTGPLVNSSGVAQSINSVTLTLNSSNSYTIDVNDADYTLANTGSSAPRCAVGSTVQSNASCQVIVSVEAC
jgi:hypothetical protein